tara:strand:+ start:333 stop:491 length:159 start_codon:yes stop_codon:yes gene_type:complete
MLEFIGLCALLLIAYKVLPDLIGFIVKVILGFIIIVIVINLFVAIGQPFVFI